MDEEKKDVGWIQQVEDVRLEKTDSGIYPVPSIEEREAVIRKLDWRLMPLIFLLYSLSVLDRSNLGNAKLAGLEESINLSGTRYQWLGTLFYIAYILFQWTVLGYKQFPAHRWIAITVFSWGFIATIQATITSWSGLMACRFLLGITEAMFGPGIPYYLSLFYPRGRVGFRIGIFISGAAMANAYGSALAYGITQIKGSIAPWQILFIIEGVPTCLLAVVMWYIIPDSIMSAKFFNEREKQVATHFLGQNQQIDADKTGLKFAELGEAFKDPKSYIPAIMYFGVNVSFASLPLFIPTIISEMGSFSEIESEGLSAPPYLLCFLVIIAVCFLSDRTRMRGPWCAAAATVAAIGFILLATTTATSSRYTGVFLAVIIFVCVALILTWTSNIHATESKRGGGYTIVATIGQCGPLLGTNVFPESQAPYYRRGMWISASMCLLVAVCSVLLSVWLVWENKKMDQERAEREERGGLREEETGAQSFRYIW